MTPTPIQQAADYATKREQARATKRANAAIKRANTRAALAEFERLAAIRAEEIAEDQAPRHQRGAVKGVTAAMLKAAATEMAKSKLLGPIAPILLREALVDPDIKRGGYRRADPLQRMHKAGPSMVTRLHLAAARRFSEDYEVGEGGASTSGGLREAVDGGGVGGVSDHRLDAMARYRGACDALGPTLRTPVQLSVLHKVSVSAMAERLGMGEKRCSGWLIGGLDRLCDFYWPDRVTRMDVVRAEELVDAGVMDVPQERLGRRRVA